MSTKSSNVKRSVGVARRSMVKSVEEKAAQWQTPTTEAGASLLNTERDSFEIDVSDVGTMPTMPTLGVTDPKRKLTREEWRALSPADRSARKAATRASRPELKTRLSRVSAKMSKRALRLATTFAGVAGVEESLRNAAMLLGASSLEMSTLPDGWRPAGRGNEPKAPKFQTGQAVKITASQRANYEGVIEADELDDLTVVAVKGKQVVVRTAGGTRMFLPIKAIETLSA